MPDLLQTISAFKQTETALRKKEVSLSELQGKAYYHAECHSLSKTLKASSSPQIIAEFKRKSPSKGIIRESADPASITMAYQQAGAAAVSVLTDRNFFGAFEDDFFKARRAINLPMLRKDFILESYQVHETKALGADLVLLIAALLNPDEVLELGSLARSLGMEVLLEIHDVSELDRICKPISLIGVNNRDLKTFQLNLENSKKLSQQLPDEIPCIAESGLTHASSLLELYAFGFKGFLIGESFMKHDDPGKACLNMIKDTQISIL